MIIKQIPLGMHIKVVGGYAFKSKDFGNYGDPVIRISDIRNGYVDISNAVRIKSEKVGKGGKYTVQGGDILMALSGATTGKLGVVPLNLKGQIYLNQRVGKFDVINPDKIDRSFLRYYLESEMIQSQIWKSAAGVAQPNISPKQLESYPIPLPPLPEQKRIASILDKADALRTLRKQAIAKLDELLQSVFLDMFGDPVTNPKAWEEAECIELCNNAEGIKCGPFGAQLAKSDYRNSGIPLWGIKHVNAGFSYPTVEYISRKKAERLKQYCLVKDDLVMTRKGKQEHLSVFIRSLVGLDRGAAKEVFSKYLDTASFNTSQIRFIEMIIDHLTQRGIMDAGLLYEQPFTGLHYEGLDGLFPSAIADEIVNIIECINANAEVHVAA